MCVTLPSGINVSGLVLATAGSDAYSRIGCVESYSHSWTNGKSLMHDGCICRTEEAEGRQCRDLEVKHALLIQPRKIILIV